jgi:hypothetical protein
MWQSPETAVASLPLNNESVANALSASPDVARFQISLGV